MDSMLCDSFHVLAQGHLIALSVLLHATLDLWLVSSSPMLGVENATRKNKQTLKKTLHD